MSDSQDIESATTALTHESQPDSKTRRYDRQLRLWAASGQSALESARILLLSASATSTSILKNLVLPGIGHFTILDPEPVSQADAGNNFFLEGIQSIGKNRAQEAVRLLGELNDGVEGKANTGNLRDILENDPEYLTSFTLIVAHNLETPLLDKLSTLLWSDTSYPSLIVVRSAGFIADFFIQFHEHTIVESHSETSPSLRIDKPFPTLLEHAVSLDFENMDPTEHGHIPYVVILVRALHDWKSTHGGNPPQTYPEKQEFKKSILAMKKKFDEENFDEAESQAYRCWTETTVPSEIRTLFSSPSLNSLSPTSPPFLHLLSALQRFSQQHNNMLPLTATLPDMKADTTNYIHLQKLYKKRAEEEKAEFKALLDSHAGINNATLDTFIKNSHALQVLTGKKWAAFDRDKLAIASALSAFPKETSTHLALSAFSTLASSPNSPLTIDSLKAEIRHITGPDAELPESLDEAIGEIGRAPTADLPNTAAFMGGLVAQEAIKLITKQYVPIKGYCVVDLVDTWTGVIG